MIYDYQLWWCPEMPTSEIVYVGGCGETRANLRLEESIREHGILNPIFAEHRVKYDHRIRTYAEVGRRRVEIARKLGIPTVGCLVASYDPQATFPGKHYPHDVWKIRALFEQGWVERVELTQARCRIDIRVSEFT